MIAFRFLGLAFWLLAALPALTQTHFAPDGWTRPQLVIAARAELPVELQSVRVRAEISGRLALSEIELTFYNPNRRILEGELQFPLLDGQSVAGFSLDINNVLREAVPVEKARGQQVFEDVIRARVDPALLEQTQGNNFKLRVYPLPASGTRRVVIRVFEALGVGGNGGNLAWRIPVEYADKLAAFSLEVRVAGASAAPQFAPGNFGGELRAAAFAREGDMFTARVEQKDFAGRGTLELRIPAASAPFSVTQSFEGKTYFYADVPLASREAPRLLPKRVGIVWDSSGSGAARDHAREFALLDAYFSKMRDGEVRLVRVRNVAEAAQTFRIKDGEWHALRAALEGTPYDGATNLGAWAPEAGIAEYLLFSDGISNFGEQRPAAPRIPVYTVNAAARADTTLLRHIADQSGGRYIDLVAESPRTTAQKLLTGVTRVTRAKADGATQLVLASPYVVHGRIAIAGLLTETETTLRLTVAHPGGKSETLQVPVRAAGATSTLAAAQWARLRIAELEAEYDFNRAEIRRLGKTFRLVTRETSLIVLDRAEDYARYEIAPPAELRVEYDRLMQLAVQRHDADRKSHLDQVVRMFNEKQAWWNRDFPKDDIAKIARTKQLNQDSRQGGLLKSTDALSMSAAPARPALAAPAPAASRIAAAEAPEGYEDRARRDASATPEKKAESAAAQNVASIRLRKWDPDALYAKRMQRAANADLYRIYLDEKPGYLDSSAFYLDAADVFFEKGLRDLGVRVLSNLAEMNLENRAILRILGYRLMQADQHKLAIPVFNKVLALSPEEPQSYRDLGLAYAADGQAQQAVDTLYEVVIRPWHGRFPEIELITLAELNAVVATSGKKLDTSRIDTRLLKNLPLDLRAVLTWDADNTDIDLWVTDPNGEKAYYGHRLTYQGGRMSLDFTGGYGPEEFSLKHAKPGKYRIEAQYFGDRRQNVTGPTTLQVKLTTRFGMPGQREQSVTLRLKNRNESILVGEFEVDAEEKGLEGR